MLYDERARVSNFIPQYCIHAILYPLNQRWLLNHNPTPTSAAYMRHLIGSALVQIMACRLFGTKPLSKPMLCYCSFEPQQTSMELQSKFEVFYSGNVFENVVCQMAAILSTGRWVNVTHEDMPPFIISRHVHCKINNLPIPHIHYKSTYRWLSAWLQ